MSRERCIAFMRDLETRDLSLLERWFTHDAVLWVPPSAPIQGVRRIQAMFRVIFRMYREIHWKVIDVHSVGGSKYIYATESWGIIGDSHPYKNHIMSVIEFDDAGRISYLSDYFKDTAIFNMAKKPAVTPL